MARVELATVLLARGEAQAALPLLREALGLRESREARRLWARALEESGHSQEALAEWKKLLPEGEAVQAVLRLERDRVSAGKALVESGAYAAALEALAGLQSPPAILLCAQALAGLGRLREAAQEYERGLAFVPHEAQAWVQYGQVLEKLGEEEKARAAYQAAGPAGAYRLGLLLEGRGAVGEAIAAYLRSPDPEARWRAARLLEGQGKVSEALALYQELAKGSARVADDAAFRAFLLLSRQGRAQEAATLKSRLPPAFLWLLGEEAPPPSVGADPQGTAPEALALAEALVARFSERGEEWAQIALEMALAQASPAEALAIGVWYAKHGEWRRAFALGARLLSQTPCSAAYSLAYPQAWKESVRRWSKEYGVDPFLVWAVMREESGFLPTAVSSAGARGLMQLLPSTARWIAEEKLGLPYREELLFDPDYNIRLGTWYLRHLLDQFAGNVAWAVAAYHGGPGNLRRWTAGLRDPRDFPAALRAPETREYLGKVLNAWLIYRWLYR
ncbi:MAG: transglycosylase SLT domain-containing protein [Candidatus Bipolaricaulota bacterium]|nr:transglycosylase SLT domain-containing protein [Candidatus Bipolaricaulota bacterium]